MIRAKNYETVFKFVKVMPRILVASFFPDTVYLLCNRFSRGYKYDTITKRVGTNVVFVYKRVTCFL